MLSTGIKRYIPEEMFLLILRMCVQSESCNI